ncbi:MAG: hypothetical protein ACREF3_06940, partial [Acetobacteraceae bacterium]
MPAMDSYNSRVKEFRLNEPDTYARNLRGATMGFQEEGYLFLICAYDYVHNPNGLKLNGMQALFLTPDDQRVIGAHDTPWFVNIGADFTQKINTVLGNPTVTVSLEG